MAVHPLQDDLSRAHTTFYYKPALWFIIASQIDPVSGIQTMYRDSLPYVHYTDCSQIAKQMNAGFLKEHIVGLAHCKGE